MWCPEIAVWVRSPSSRRGNICLMKWRNHTINGEVFVLEHLQPFTWELHQPCTDKHPARDFRFHVTFSCHCFTRKPDDGETVDPEYWYQAPRETRVFCLERWSFSKSLPTIIQELDQRRCYHTGHRNFFTIDLIEPNGIQRDYEVYFDVNRSERKGWLNLVVQSAYVRDPGYRSAQPRKRAVKFGIIARLAQHGRKPNPGR